MNLSAGVAVHLLGRPRIEVDGASGYRFRSRKSWALLAFLLLAERPPTRSRLASLLFAEADDPLRALRWCLAEVRRGLGPGAVLDGDPVQLTLPPGASVDVDVLVHGHWNEALQLPGLGLDLLDGVAIAHAEPFEAWLLSQRRRLSAAAESIVHEAALGLLARGELERARELAVQATVMSPLDENHQALLIRIYRLAGDQDAAARQFDSWSATAERELGTSPGCRGAPGGARATRGGAGSGPGVDPRGHRGRCGRRLRRGPRGRGGVVRGRGADGRPVGRRQRAGPGPAGAGGGADPHAGRPRRGRAGGADRGGADRHRAGRPGIRGAGPRRARLRRLPPGPLRPRRAAARPGARGGRGVAVGPGEGDDLPGLGRERSGRLPAGGRPARGRDPRLPARWASRVARRSRCRCWAGSASCAATSTPRTSTSGRGRAGRGRALAVVPAVAAGAVGTRAPGPG